MWCATVEHEQSFPIHIRYSHGQKIHMGKRFTWAKESAETADISAADISAADISAAGMIPEQFVQSTTFKNKNFFKNFE
jgi:hypothetical protein